MFDVYTMIGWEVMRCGVLMFVSSSPQMSAANMVTLVTLGHTRVTMGHTAVTL